MPHCLMKLTKIGGRSNSTFLNAAGKPGIVSVIDLNRQEDDNQLAGTTITAAQCRAGRALVGMQQGDLADRARVARKTLVDFEAGGAVPNSGNLIAITAVLDNAGVEFIAEDAAGGPGVRLRAKKR